MPVNEIVQALGSWQINLSENTPKRILDQLDYFGHVAVHAAREVHPELIGDALLKTARYVGVLRGREFTGSQGQYASDQSATGSPLARNEANSGSSISDSNLIRGSGMAYWLGDEDQKGAVIEFPGLTLPIGTLFSEGVRALLPGSGSITEGTFHPVTGSWSGTYIYVSPRQALTDFVSYFSNEFGECEWRANPDGTLDAGYLDQLYVVEPKAIIARKQTGQDLHMRGIRGTAQTDEDMEDFSTRVVVLAQGIGDSVATGAANIDPGLNPYVDLHGNPVVLTRMVSQEGTDPSNAPASAVLQLNRFLKPRSSLQLTSDEIDLKGAFACGDYIWIYDPDTGLIDYNNETIFRGRLINPTKLRVTELSWPIIDGMGVAFRRQDGTWLDLTDYIYFEEADNVDVVVGDLSRTLLNTTGGETVGGRPKPDSSIPDVTQWLLPFNLSSYQSSTGITRSQVALAWERPLNTDGTAIIDGDHYEIRWRTSSHQILPVSWAYLAQSSSQWIDLVEWDGLLPFPEGPWQYTAVGFDQEAFLLSDLTPGVPYDIEIRAVDSASPPNYGLFNDPSTFETQSDPYPPSEPAPPEVASSLIAVQVLHRLGKSSGGTFNLEADLHHLEVHASFDSTFTPDESTLLGKMLCNAGTLLSGTPVVGTYQIALTTAVWIKVVAVDEAGNRSGASGGSQSSAELIDDEHISSLTVSKVTAGEITTTWLVGGTIATGTDGARAGLDAFGFFAYDDQDNLTFEVDAQTGDVYMVGTLDTSRDGSRVRIAPSDPSHILDAPGIYMWAKGSNNPGLMFAVPEGGDPSGIPTSIAITSSLDETNNSVGTMYVRDNRVYLGMRTYVNPDLQNPHGSYLEDGAYFTAKPDIAEIAMVGQVNSDDSIVFDGGFVQISRTVSALGFQLAGGLQHTILWDTGGSVEMKGPWGAKFTGSPILGMFIGNFTPTGSGGGATVSYGVTYTIPRVVLPMTISPSVVETTQVATSGTASMGLAYSPSGTFTIGCCSFGVDS